MNLHLKHLLAVVLTVVGGTSVALAQSSSLAPPATSATSGPAPAAPVTQAEPDNSGPYPHQDEAAALRWLDQRLLKGQYIDMYNAIQSTMANEDRPELAWRYARILVNYYEINRTAPDEAKLKAYQLSEQLTRRCIAKDPTTTPGCYLYLGIALGRQGTLKGVLKSLRLAKEVEASWVKGLELSKGKGYKFDNDPLESHFYYVLGIFYRILPDWWIIKLIAGTRGDKVKSIEYNRESVRMRPDTATYLELGVSLICHGQKEDVAQEVQEGIGHVQHVIAMKPANDLDRVDQRNARMVLADPKKACGYSRDKFQNVEDKNAVK